MNRLTNIFSALNFVEDDEDLNPEVNSKAKMRADSFKSKGSKRSIEERNFSKDREELYQPLVWIDLEMTGLDLEKDHILEIACIITDGKLKTLIEGPDLIIHQSADVLTQMNDWCQEHHGASGLTEAVRKSTITVEEAEKRVLKFVGEHVAFGSKALLAGNSIYVDLSFLKKYMPKLAELFPHVLVDVSSVRALCKRWYPNDAEKAPQKKKLHRALEDIKESIAELRYLQGSIFKRSKCC